MDGLKEIDEAAMFAAGALSSLEGTGASEKEARSFVTEVCKEAAFNGRRMRYEEDEEDEEEDRRPLWKRLAVPAGVGLAAFLLGAGAERFGRPAYSYFSNAGNFLWDRVKKLLGVNDSAISRSMTKADPSRASRELNELLELEKSKKPFASRIGMGMYAPEGNSSLSAGGYKPPESAPGGSQESYNDGKSETGQ